MPYGLICCSSKNHVTPVQLFDAHFPTLVCNVGHKYEREHKLQHHAFKFPGVVQPVALHVHIGAFMILIHVQPNLFCKVHILIIFPQITKTIGKGQLMSHGCLSASEADGRCAASSAISCWQREEAMLSPSTAGYTFIKAPTLWMSAALV